MFEGIYTETLKDKFTLSPFEKYSKYGRFPFKFLISCALVFMTTFQVILISEHYTYNSSGQIIQFVALLLNPDEPMNNKITLLTIEDFQDSLNNTLNNLANIDDITAQKTTILGETFFQINYNYPYQAYRFDYHFVRNLTLGEPLLDPFNLEDDDQIRDFWTNAYELTLTVNKVKVESQQRTACWDIQITYQFINYGYIDAIISSIGGICADNREEAHGSAFNSIALKIDNLLLQLSIILLALVDVCLGVKYIYEVIEMYTNNISKLKKQRKLKVPDYKLYKNQNLTTLKIILTEQKPWEQLTIKEKLLFFDLFLPIRILGNILQLISAGILVSETFIRVDGLSQYDELMAGLGCFFAWFSIVKYLDYYEELHLIASVLESSIIPVCMAILNFLPVFLGYALLGMCLFSDSHQFVSLSSSINALFSLIYGDSISDVARDSSRGVSLEVSLIYIVTYILLFLFAVHNIMVALIKEQLEIRRDLIFQEKELMNQLDLSNNYQYQMYLSQKMKQSAAMNRSVMKDDFSSILQSQSGSNQQQQMNKQISLKSITKLAMMQKQMQEDVSKQDMEKNWKEICKEEMQNHYIYNILISTISETKNILSNVELELWNDIDSSPFTVIDKKEIITLYCSQLIRKHQKMRKIFDKTKQISQNLKP
ncbi:unnamed protein product (macronuclear) [Paramecium tetraurelia]|uniref:Polycystin cation channel PKD1/PKD2 domain-containing protein n=1 Tax=Paramecium tetraurelia TaxID=5888 RepID=A0DNM4_PARTE|nr:uncharacterized protein GSPATT00018837001 [Paramecium tetraurelia]CAK84641.1 unnamed protein product [Paramecium tetraurelia]|eukprot:XP_001452038.1 hypothetical protein (macronuclear) [Paramecium tetraurelia strain d4-2]